MTQIHVVSEGDSLPSIAERYGFENFETIWNAPQNERLRGHRENPTTLLPGDEVVIPQKTSPAFERKASQSHRFTIHVPKLILRFEVRDPFGKPIAETSGTLAVDGVEHAVTSDVAGQLEIPISRDARAATLTLGDWQFDLAIGALHPLSEDSGVEQRLTNLGYPMGHPSDEDIEHAEQTRFAIELLQRDLGLSPSGEMTPELLDRLAQMHGC